MNNFLSQAIVPLSIALIVVLAIGYILNEPTHIENDTITAFEEIYTE